MRRPSRKKRKYELGGYSLLAKVGGKDVRVKERVRGGSVVVRTREVSYANVYDPESGASRKVRIVRVLENRANREYVRLGIVTRGAVVETEIGPARVTSRPSRDGVVNAVLIRS